ncbi:MAG TPA: ComEC/Rec2 family competence protein, partial [Verrucomicrobiae bacterium]|nr:ComEC/Rec2 family competence protein [Verrucomicrobiae bacterium]
MKRPLVAVVIAYGTGLLLAEWLHPPLAALLTSVGILGAFVLVLKNQRKFLIWPLLALVGWANFTWRASIQSPDDLRVVLGDRPALVTVRGTLVETPRLKILEEKGQEIWRSVARVRVQEMTRTDDFRPVTGEILVVTPGVLGPEFFSGQLVEISGAISRPPMPLAEGLFNFQNYLATRGIYYELQGREHQSMGLAGIVFIPAAADGPFFEMVAGDARAGFAGGRRAVAVAVGDDAGLAHGVHRRYWRPIFG